MAQMPLCLAVGLRVFLRLSFVCAQLPLFATALVRSSAGGREGPRRHIALQQKEKLQKKQRRVYVYAISYVLSLQRSMPAAYLFPSEYPSFGPRSSLFSGPGATEPASSAVAAEERVVA